MVWRACQSNTALHKTIENRLILQSTQCNIEKYEPCRQTKDINLQERHLSRVMLRDFLELGRNGVADIASKHEIQNHYSYYNILT